MCIWLVALLARGGGEVQLHLAEIVHQIESPMAFWLGTTIEKGQLASCRYGCELTGEIWSWGLPEEKRIKGEISIGKGWPTTLNHSWLKN